MLARYIEASQTEKDKIRKQVDDVLSGDEKLRSKRELIEQFIATTLPHVSSGEEVDGAFQKFWSEKERQAIEQFAREEGLDTERLQKLIGNYSYSGRQPRQDDYARALLKKPPIRERSTLLSRIASRFKKFVEVFVENV